MKIAYLSAEYPPVWGGMGVHTFCLSAAVASLGHEVTIITRRQPKKGEAPPNPGVQIVYRNTMRFPSFSALLFGKSAVHTIRDMGCPFDIVHLMYPLIALRQDWFRWISCPVVSTMHGTWYGERAALRHKTGAKSINDWAIHYLSPYFEKFERLALEKSALTLAVSEYCRQELLDHYGAASDEITVLSNGVDTHRFAPQPGAREYLEKKYHIDPNTGIILYVGRFAARKGLPFLLQSFQHLLHERGARAHLLLVGDGLLRQHLMEAVKHLGISKHVSFTGNLDINELVRHYAGATVFVLPSSYEGQGIVLLEAMACGVLCVATNVSAIPEMIVPDKTGFLVNYGQIEEMSSTLFQVLSDRELSKCMAKAARERVLQEYDWRHIAQKLVILYEKISKTKGVHAPV